MKNTIIPFSVVIMFCVIFLSSLSLSSCKKEVPLNPFDRNLGSDSTILDAINAKRIEGLYQNVFKPNCSTSGCHDGTFDPDFRSIESSYNTLVWSGVVNNDPSNPLNYRVEPKNASNSMLIKRLSSFVPNTSGVMPLEVSPDSDWNEKKEAYIQDIKDWINDGAKDIFGNEANTINLKPQLTGFNITAAGSNTPYPRNVNGVILVPSNATSIDLYIGISDKETSSDLLTGNELKLSIAQADFSQALSYNMNIISPISATGYAGNVSNFYHKISIANINTLWNIDEYVFIKAIVNDGVNPDSNLPGENTLDHIKYFYSFKRTL